MYVMPDTQRRALLAAMVAVGSDLENVSLKLYQNDITPTRASVAGDFTECNFTGYSDYDATADWLAPYTDALGIAHVNLPSHQFTQTDTVATNIAYGWFLVETAGGLLVAAERFDAAFPFAATGTALTVIAGLQFSGG